MRNPIAQPVLKMPAQDAGAYDFKAIKLRNDDYMQLGKAKVFWFLSAIDYATYF